MEGIFWLVLLAVLLVAEIATLGLTTIWFACGSLIAFLASLLSVPLWIQVFLFIIVSLIMLFFTRPLAMKYINARTTKTNAESIVGKTAEVTQDIDNIRAQGQVIIDGMDWTARSVNDAVTIAKGTLVVVEGISGVKLMVREKKEGVINE